MSVLTRLGLFLAILASLAGHRWYLDAAIPCPNGSIFLMFDHRGWVVTDWLWRRDRFLRINPASDGSPLDHSFSSAEWTDILSYRNDYVIETNAMVLIRQFNHGAWQGTSVALRHWLIVMLLIIFDVVLCYFRCRRTLSVQPTAGATHECQSSRGAE
jgi:UDP-N-acetylmuramyl pentapeptide phosphotransferase/UDP-N-acetylglucosamine-1-phosphate transferase